MSSDRLIQAEPEPLHRAILAVLGGLPLPHAAHQYEVDPTILSDAVARYDQAGREALTRQPAPDGWWQAYLHFTDWTQADAAFADHVLPLLQRIGLSIRGQSILAWTARAAILHNDNRA